VAEDVPTRQLFYLTEHAARFPGVAPEVLALREYPAGTAAAHVLGYVGGISPGELKTRRFRGYQAGDIIGKAGVELTYDSWLRAATASRTSRSTRPGRGCGPSAAARPSPVATSS
jgi:penicillin-binding protein 2